MTDLLLALNFSALCWIGRKLNTIIQRQAFAHPTPQETRAATEAIIQAEAERNMANHWESQPRPR